MNWKRSRAVMMGGILVGLVITVGETSAGWPGMIGLIVMIGSILQTCLFYRCPFCGRALNVRGGPLAYCPHCGKKLD